MDNSFLLLLQLLLAHIVVDFILQPKSWIVHKRKYKARSYILVIHSLLAGLLTLVFLQSLEWWYAALFISITHYLIDWWKLQQKEDDLKYFLLDTITDKWSTASAEVVYYLLRDLKEREIAAEIHISQSAVNQRKNASGWEAIAGLLSRYNHVIKTQLKNGKQFPIITTTSAGSYSCRFYSTTQKLDST